MAIFNFYYSKIEIHMRFRFILRFTALAILVLISHQAFAQSGSSQRSGSNTSGAATMSLGGEGLYYVDEVGIRIATESSPFEGFVNENEYIVGAQDILSVEVHGTIPMTWRGMVVNAEGYLIIPTIGNVFVGDVTLAEAKERVKHAIVEKIRSDKVLVTLEMPKPVNIHVVGDLSSPGRYTFPAHSRLDFAVVNLLVGFTSKKEEDSEEPVLKLRSYTISSRSIGQPFTEDVQSFDLSQFNLRNMVIKHRNGSETNADVLAYLNGGVIASNPYLRDGDIIMIRRTDKLAPKISMSGAVKSGFTSDFRNDDNVAYLLNVAGGYDIEADSTHFFVARMMGDSIERIRIEGSASTNDSFMLHPNDRVIVPRTERSKDNQSVWISGEVVTPGSYPIVENKTSIFDVLNTTGGLTSRSLPSAAFIERTMPNDFYYSFGLSEEQMMERTSDQLLDGLDYLRLERELSSRFLFVDLRDETRARQIMLKNGDRIHVPNDEKTVLVMGQVNKTGYYPYSEGMDAQGYIQFAGGYTLSAEIERTFIIKAGSREWRKPGETKVESGDIVFIDRQPTDEFIASRTYKLQKSQQRLQTVQVALSTVATLVSVVLTYIALSNQ